MAKQKSNPYSEKQLKRLNHKQKCEFTKKNKQKKALKKELGVPDLSSQKKQLLAELQRKKPTEERTQQISKLMQNSKQELYCLLASAESRNFSYQEPQDSNEGLNTDYSRKAYYKELIKVIESADIILEVLDAREPQGCRSQELENKVMSHGKRLVVVLNKIDLVPGECALAWHNYISQSFPCIMFRSNTQTQHSHLSSAYLAPQLINSEHGKELLNSNKAIGTEALMSLLKNYMRNGDTTSAVTVGVVGFPNVGKSSLINSLRRAKAVGVSSQPGFTKSIQEVEIERQIKILDCPGIVFGGNDTPDMVLRNVIKIENLEDPLTPVQAILTKVNPLQLMEFYGIPEYSELKEFLAQVARKRGKLKKGGVPDFEAAAKVVLHDWTSGKIPYYTFPPEAMC